MSCPDFVANIRLQLTQTCVPGMTYRLRGVSPRSRYERSRRKGNGPAVQQDRREAGSGGSLIHALIGIQNPVGTGRDRSGPVATGPYRRESLGWLGHSRQRHRRRFIWPISSVSGVARCLSSSRAPAMFLYPWREPGTFPSRRLEHARSTGTGSQLNSAFARRDQCACSHDDNGAN